MYANCSNCQLSIKVRQPWAAPEYCPRCVGRWRLASPMFQSPLPYRLLAAAQQDPPLKTTVARFPEEALPLARATERSARVAGHVQAVDEPGLT